MKNLFKSLVVGALLLGSVGCSDMFKEDLYEINNEIDKINQRIDSLCNAVNTNIASLQTIIDVMQDNDYVDSITPIVENGVTIGYEIVFTQSGSVKIYHGEKGETGATGHSPVVGVKQAEDGRWYWTIDGEWMVNAEGKKILAEAIDGEDGAPGADGIPGIDGITPKLKVQDNYWYISYDNGTTWERLGKATGEAGTDGDSMFQSVNYNEDYVELVLVDGTVLTIPTWASHMLLVDEIAKINNNISALQAAVKALESNDYVQKVTPVKDEDGNVIGYTLQFAFTGDVTIYHGEDGEKGEDGHTPVIGVKQFNGEWYWTIDGEWLVDGNGEMVPTSGEDGAEGAEGQAGITPELKIEDDYWYVSYDKGQTWTKLGKAKGEDGAAGGDGAAGDAFFEDVDTSDEYYIILTLADGTEIKIPTWKAHQALADAVAQLNTNFESLQVIITGLQNNDYITGYTPIIDPQTNEEIGYTLHFLKAGDIEIYHGTSPAAPEIGIKKHPQYGLCWTYDGEYIKDPSTGKPVALPQDGADAVAPKFKIEDGRWWMSTDGGRSWEDIGQATGDQGQQGETGATGGAGDSFFKSIEPEFATDANGNVLKDAYGKPIVAYIVMTLAGDNDGEDVVYKVPTEYITSDLNKRLAAIEAQFSTISTIVNALQNAEYIKEVVELYEGPALVGYEITFVKYAIGADGKLTETTRKSTIRNGGAGAAGTVVAAEYDEATDTWYWTLDGEPLKDADGNYVAINGKNGQAGITPLMRINTDTNEWEVSYDNGKTYTTTGVKATGPQGPQGNPGQGGAAGDSFFADVYKDGDYWVFERVSGDKIMVPTAEAFASLAAKVAALDESSKAFASLINGKKFIESCEPFTNDSGSGYKLVLVSLNAETGETVKEDYFIFDGEDAETPIVGLRQDETTGDWYWTVDGEDILVDGKPVKANGPQGIDGPVPSFRIDPTNGHLYVTVNGTESDLGRVVGTNGSAGEAGSSSSIVVTPGEDGQLTIDFIGGDGLTSTIVVPSWEAFVALQETVSALNTNVETISALVYGHKYVESFKELENGGYEFVVRYYDEAAKEWKAEVHTIDVTTADEIGVKQDTDGNYYWTKGGEWLLDAAGNKVMVDGSAERILEFDSKNDGKLYYRYSDETEWTVLDIAVSESEVDSNVVVKEEDGKVTVTVLDDAGMILYSFSAPSWEAFEALQGRVIALEEQVTDIYDLIDQLTTNYQALSGDVKTMAAKLAKCKFIGEYEYDEENKGHVIYLVDIDGNKLQNAAGDFETIFIADGEDGEDFDASMLSFTEVDGEYFWTYNGEMLLDAEGNPVKAHGADGIDGKTPEFRIFNDVLQYKYEGEGDDAWQSLGNVKGSASAANITVENPANPNQSMWIMIQYTYTDAQGNEIIEEVKLPTYYAYEKALEEIAAIQSTIEMVETFLKGNKFVSDYELTYDNNGMVSGCTVTTVEYKLQEDGSYRVFESKAEFNPSQTMSVKLENDVWYLVFYNENGEEVKRPLSQSTFTFVPKVAVNNGYLYVAKVSEPGNDYTDTTKWDCLGAVVELLGGETQGALKSVEEVDGYICFTFSNGEVLKVPSEEKFQEVLDRLDAVEARVEDLEAVVAVHASTLEGLSALSGNVTDLMQDVATLKTLRFIGTPVQTENGWDIPVYDGTGKEVADEKIVLTNGADGTVVTIVKGDDDKYYWAINGVQTEYAVTGNDGANGKTPVFQINTTTGKLEYKFEGDENWTELGKVVGEDGTPGTNGATNVVFASAVEFDENGAYVSYTKAESANAALWVGVQFGTGETDFIWMPTYKNFQALAAQVVAVETRVTTLETTVALHETAINSLVTLSTDVNGLIEDVAKLKTYKFIGTPVQTENGWTIPVVNGAGEPVEGEAITLTNGADGTVVTIVKGDDDKYYWAIDGVKTEYAVTGNDGKTPIFQINSATGKLEYKFEGDENWIELDKVVGEPGTDGATNVVFASAVEFDENGAYVSYTKAESANAALWVGVQFGTGETDFIWMPTYKNFQALQALVTTLNTNVNTLSGLINGKRFITSINKWSGEVNGVQRTGTEITYVEIKDNVAQPEAKMYIYDGLAGADGVTVGVAVWAEADGGDNKTYWTITKDGVTSFLTDKDGNKILAVGTDGTPGENGLTPEFKIENDILYWKYTDDGDDKWNELGNVKGDPGIPGEPGAPGADALKNVTDNGTYYTITYSDNTTVNVQKWVDASNVSVQFSLNAISWSAVTEAEVGGPVTVYYEISGAVTEGTTPKISASCEGGYFVSELVQPGDLTLGVFTPNRGSVTITPTYAFSSGVQNGRLTLFVDYYGITIPVELKLKGTANVEVHQTITVEASNGSAEIDLADLGLTGRPALGFSYSYNDFVDRTGQSDNFVYADKVGTSTDKWISRGTSASAIYNQETGKEILTISDNPTNQWRAGMVIVYPSKDSQVELAHIKIIQKPGETNLANPDKSGPDDPANCYVVSEPGRYLIPTYKGNNTTQTYDFSTIDTPISDGTGVTISNPEKVVKDGKQYISFDVNMSQTTGTSDVVNNNSMIAIRDANGNVVWSWHLWFTSGVENSNFGILGGATYNTNATMLNRNIGADAARSTGMYYKWGDKDPYFTTTGGSTDYHGGTDAGDWSGATKSMTDPCPPGYRVPSTAVWNPNQNAATIFGTDYFTYEGSPLVLYPYSGLVNESGTYQGETSTTVQSQTPQDDIVETEDIPTADQTTSSLTGHLSPAKYRNIIFTLKTTVTSGLLHAIDGNFLYGYSKNGLDNILSLLLSDDCTIISYEKLSGTLTKNVHYTETGRIIKTRTYNGKEPDWGAWQTIKPNAIEAIKIKGFVKDYLESIGVVNTETYQIAKTVNSTQGYQVRCVSENSTVK